jgi:hypothetical protein
MERHTGKGLAIDHAQLIKGGTLVFILWMKFPRPLSA